MFVSFNAFDSFESTNIPCGVVKQADMPSCRGGGEPGKKVRQVP